MRHLIPLLIIFFTIVACNEDHEVKNNLIGHIPTGAQMIVHVEEIDDLSQFFTTNELYAKLSGLARIQELKKASSFLKDYNLNGESLIALNIEGKNKAVVTLITAPIEQEVDATNATSIIDYNGAKITETKNPSGRYYSLNHNGVHLASNSILIIESLVRRNVADYIFDGGFEHIYKRTKKGNTFYIKASHKSWLEQFLLGNHININGNHAQWYQLETTASSSSFQLDGVITYLDSLKMDHDLYNKLEAVENQIQNIVPSGLRSLKTVTYKKPAQLIDNLKRYHSSDIKVGSRLLQLLDNTQEMAELQLENTSALVFTLRPYEELFIDLDSLSKAKVTYRDQMIYELVKPLETYAIQPLVQSKSYAFTTIIDQHLIYATAVETLEEVISNYQNKTVLGQQQWYMDASQNLSTSSSLLKITSLKELKELAKNKSKEDLKIINQMDENFFPLMISQYVHEDEYAHYHFLVPFNSKNNNQLQVSQLGVFKANSKIISGPFLFPNHLSKRHDIAVQDEQFVLHLLSDTGKKWWSRPLDGPILGEIQVADAYKNGRKQMAFATSKSVYFIDRNGKDVASYPKNFKDQITQPLSVFDYDNNRDYRFLVTQGSDMLLLDKNGASVSGFNYKKAAAITTQPKHFRVGDKDYIAFAKADNTIAILNRTGDSRTNVKDKLTLVSDLFFFKNKIVAMTNKQQIAEVNLANGKISLSEAYKSNSRLEANANVKLVQDNNTIFINDKKVTLPYGTYLDAKLMRLPSGDFIYVTDVGENKVYVLDKNGEIIPSLPVYGTSNNAIAQSKNRYLVTLDGSDVIIYKW
jgi:hypothetical protein